MDIAERLVVIRKKRGMSQQEMADKLFVTRQAVSRWENGETQPNMDTLRQISKVFDVSIDALMGTERERICQCCGMPLTETSLFSREPDGSINDEYCKWCYVDGQFTYDSMDRLIDTCVPMLANSTGMTQDEARNMMERMVPELKHWKERA